MCAVHPVRASVHVPVHVPVRVPEHVPVRALCVRALQRAHPCFSLCFFTRPAAHHLCILTPSAREKTGLYSLFTLAPQHRHTPTPTLCLAYAHDPSLATYPSTPRIIRISANQVMHPHPVLCTPPTAHQAVWPLSLCSALLCMHPRPKPPVHLAPATSQAAPPSCCSTKLNTGWPVLVTCERTGGT